ncbi:MAG: hypothetical protein JJU27_10335 [Gammaproteobacteria bacterium]|nr:hypothetical protein [Gammaproteobacteria bacterium]
MQTNFRALAAVAALALCLGTSARAEIVLEMEERDGEDVFPVKMVVGSGRLAAIDEDGDVEMIFDRGTDTIYTIDHDTRSYVRLNRENIGDLVGQVDTAMAEMRRQLEAMPPDQREAVERMMGGMGGGAAPPPREMRETGRRGEAAGIACRWHDIYEGDTQVGTACIADADAVPGGDEMVAMINAMSAIYEELMRQLADSVPMGLPANPILPMTETGGLPIRSTETRDGEDFETVLLAVREESVDPSVFQLPAGYTESGFGD